jgi:hypothetical protein
MAAFAKHWPAQEHAGNVVVLTSTNPLVDWADLFDGDLVETRLVRACAAWLRASNNPTQVL